VKTKIFSLRQCLLGIGGGQLTSALLSMRDLRNEYASVAPLVLARVPRAFGNGASDAFFRPGPPEWLKRCFDRRRLNNKERCR
jgi:hypothetical protein